MITYRTQQIVFFASYDPIEDYELVNFLARYEVVGMGERERYFDLTQIDLFAMPFELRFENEYAWNFLVGYWWAKQRNVAADVLILQEVDVAPSVFDSLVLEIA